MINFVRIMPKCNFIRLTYKQNQLIIIQHEEMFQLPVCSSSRICSYCM